MQADEERGKFIRVTGAPARFARLRFEDMDSLGNEASLSKAVKVAACLQDGERVSLVICGPFGTGKTRVAVWLLRNAWDACRKLVTSTLDFPRFFRAPDLAELRFGRSFSAPEDEEDRKDADRTALDRAPVVVIDDVGRVSGYKGEELFIEAVVEKRYDADLSTILTMNEVPREGRFADFLDYFEELTLAGRSHRSD